MARARKPRISTWREVYSAEPWYTTGAEDTCEDMILCIYTPEGKDPRARKIIHRGGGGRRRKFCSKKVGRYIHCQSELEFHYCHILEVHPDVSSFCEQAIEIHYRLNGETYVHVPDQLINRDSRSLIRECKFRSDAEDPEVLARTELLTRCLPPIGLDYAIVTEEVIQREPRLQNADDMIKFGRTPLEAKRREEILRVVDSGTPVTWGGAITGQLGDRGRECLCRMVREGVLWFDIDKHLLPSTRFLRKTDDLTWNYL
jgi:hypothetical protein